MFTLSRENVKLVMTPQFFPSIEDKFPNFLDSQSNRTFNNWQIIYEIGFSTKFNENKVPLNQQNIGDLNPKQSHNKVIHMIHSTSRTAFCFIIAMIIVNILMGQFK